MTRLIVIVLVGALAWMTWWAFGQAAYERGLKTWIDQRRDEGWAADVGALATVGFPNRFDTTLRDLRLADPETGIAWSVPQLEFLSLAYKPHQVIAVLPEDHRFSTPSGTYDISHADARASLFLKAETALGLDRAILVLDNLKVATDADWTASLSAGRFAAESVPVAETTYRLGAEISELTPALAVRRMLDPTGLLPETIASLRFDAEVVFDKPWDRFAIEDARPQPTHIELADLSAEWGTVTFRAVGELAIDDAGIAEGDVTIRAVEWRKILDMAVGSGLLPGSAVGPLERALTLMSGPLDTLDTTLSLRDGFIRLGIIPIAPAPRFVLR